MIRFEDVSMSYGEHEVIKNLNLHIKEGQLAVLIGPSGCGKTTTLQLINRLLLPTSGKIYIGGKDISTVDAVQLRRNVGYVIQEIGLFPHMTIKQNIEIVPKLLKWSEKQREERSAELLKLVGMDESYLSRYPAKLSGGQQQRIGLLRALAAEPPIILMDEPFGALDPITRETLQDEILSLQKKLHKTIVFVTHDMDEAIKIADIIVLMKDGVVLQVASPKDLLSAPANEYVEQFIGKHRIYGNKVDTVRDVMSENVVCVQPEMSLVESVALMGRKRVPTLFVVDERKWLLGQISIEDIREHRHNSEVPVRDILHKEIISVRPDDSANDVFDLMMREHLDVLPVVDENRIVLGVVTHSSMVKSLAGVVWRGDKNDGLNS
ncbi:MAG: ABC transporter ATP-binding protein [Clostridia bacterium]|nr:ABC transporter ATP-binding protein [Clostridia bacterium]